MSGGSMSPGRLPATETSSLEDPNFKSARISVEERREKIHRYIKKRNERNFSKKIKVTLNTGRVLKKKYFDDSAPAMDVCLLTASCSSCSQQWQYACRKTLADSRPRVRGRFAKNDDYGEPSTAMQNHDESEQMVRTCSVPTQKQLQNKGKKSPVARL
jgi:hypothetical protein